MKEDFFYKKESEELYLSEATKYAKEKGMSIKKRLGSGNWGVAYLTNNGDVIKATGDPAEVFNSLSIKNIDFDHVAKITDVSYSVDKDIAIIRQEKVNPLNVIELKRLKTIENKITEADQSLVSFDEYELIKEGVKLTEKELKMLRDIHSGINEMYDNKGTAEDIDESNIGKNIHGNYVIFDQKSISCDPADFIYTLNKIKNKTKKTKNQKPF